MSKIDFQELFKQAVEVKKTGADKTGLVDVAIVTFACAAVLTAITGTCFGEGEKSESLPQTPGSPAKQ